MGRIVGDGAINFDIVDVAVDPAHRGKGLGRLVMEKLVARWTLTPLMAPTLRWWRMCRNCTRSSASKAFARRARDGPRLANPQSLARISCREKSVVQMATRLTARSSLC